MRACRERLEILSRRPRFPQGRFRLRDRGRVRVLRGAQSGQQPLGLRQLQIEGALSLLLSFAEDGGHLDPPAAADIEEDARAGPFRECERFLRFLLPNE